MGLLASLCQHGIRGIALSHDELRSPVDVPDGRWAAVVSRDHPGDDLVIDALVSCDLPVVVLGDGEPCALWALALARGATAAVHRLASLRDAVMTIDAALDGHVLMPRDIARSLATTRPSGCSRSRDRLSDEDVVVLRSIAEGQTVVQIAELIHRSERDTYRALAKLWKRLGVENRSEAIVYAARCGILDHELV